MDWIHRFIPGNDGEGNPILSVLAKRTYAIAPGSVKPAERQLPLIEADTFADPQSPSYSEVTAESDLIPYKPGTDVVVTGKAHSPRGKSAYHLDCGVTVGPLSKTIRVFGDRAVTAKAFRGLTFGDPRPFDEMLLGYACAYGGIIRSKEGTIYSYFPNPIGKGFTLKGAIEDPATIVLPNIEDPDSPLDPDTLILAKFDDWINAPKPASLGWTRRNSYPRYTYAGVLPEFLEAATRNLHELQSRTGAQADTAIPRMDMRFFQGASDGLWGKLLNGGEGVRLSFLDAEHPTFEFALPVDRPAMSMNIGDGPAELKPVLQTVVIDKENNTLAMVWRGSLKYGGIASLETLPTLEITVE